MKGQLKTCSEGHSFYKNSDCPTCPICEKLKKPDDGFLAAISAPARRALLAKNIETLEALSTYKKSEIEELHGIGKKVMELLQTLLIEDNKDFAK